MNHVPIKLGPLALLLSAVSICLTVLAVLSFTTARADLALAERYAETVSTRYAIERQGQSFLAEAEPGERREFEQDGMFLTVELDGEGNVICWTYEKQWTEDNTVSGLWKGN